MQWPGFKESMTKRPIASPLTTSLSNCFVNYVQTYLLLFVNLTLQNTFFVYRMVYYSFHYDKNSERLESLRNTLHGNMLRHINIFR